VTFRSRTSNTDINWVRSGRFAIKILIFISSQPNDQQLISNAKNCYQDFVRFWRNCSWRYDQLMNIFSVRQQSSTGHESGDRCQPQLLLQIKSIFSMTLYSLLEFTYWNKRIFAFFLLKLAVLLSLLLTIVECSMKPIKATSKVLADFPSNLCSQSEWFILWVMPLWSLTCRKFRNWNHASPNTGAHLIIYASISSMWPSFTGIFAKINARGTVNCFVNNICDNYLWRIPCWHPLCPNARSLIFCSLQHFPVT